MGKIHRLSIQELPADLTPDNLPESLYDLPHFVLLESSLGGRYTIAAWEPSKVLAVSGDSTSFFKMLRDELLQSPAVEATDWPFTGGWIGYLGYGLYSELEPKVPPRKSDLIPKAVMAYYDHFYLFDHRDQKAFLCSAAMTPAADSWSPRGLFDAASRVQEGADRRAPAFGCRPPLKDAGEEFRRGRKESAAGVYLDQIQRIKDLIAAGDCYQVNLSQKFTVPIEESAFEIYRRLRQASPSPYAAYLNLGNAQILSSSPECFLSVDGRRIVTRPIKGTRPRGETDIEDATLKEELAMSEKDRAELLMITDLERNDLGRVCTPGSVRVTDLAKVETYPQVHHLVSTIEGELAEGRDLVDLLQATFPGGSITGAPKIRAMQVIRDLEPHAREVYCGAIGYLSTNGKSQFNVAIRTMVVKNGEAHFWSGGGIVADSDPEAEYREILVKAEGLKKALGR